jgi:lipoprotein NlpI
MGIVGFKMNLCRFVLLGALALFADSAPAATEVDLNGLFRQIQSLLASNRFPEAHALLDKAIADDRMNSQLVYARGQVYEASQDHARAILSFTEVIRLDPKSWQAYQQRGAEHFRLGEFNESIADFDNVVRLRPTQEPYFWQRGISYYYAGRYTDGRKQFELHQTVNPNDVENAVWHFLCVAKESGLVKARSMLIPISGDSRIPMMEVHGLFAGQLKPEDVLAAAKKGDPGPAELKHRQFYANLYLGLYFDATGDEVSARKYILAAAGMAESGDYMGDVARVHAWLFGKKGKKK